MTQVAYPISLLLLASFFAGTAYAIPDEVSAGAVERCQFLSDVKGNSGYGKNTGWQAIARKQALKKAEAIGATHLVWRDFRPIGAFNGEAIGQVYDCRR